MDPQNPELLPRDDTRHALERLEKKIAELLQMISSLTIPTSGNILHCTVEFKRENERVKHTVMTATDISEEVVQRVVQLPILPTRSGKYTCTCQQCPGTRTWVSHDLPPRCSDTKYRHTKWWLTRAQKHGYEPTPDFPAWLHRLIAEIPEYEQKSKRP